MSRRRRKAVGAPPGTLEHVGERRVERIGLTATGYSPDYFEEQKAEQAIPVLEKAPLVRWIDIDGLHEAELVQELGNQFRIHPLVLEDIMNTASSPKVDIMPDSIFLVCKAFHVRNTDVLFVEMEHISLVLGRDYLLTFQEQAEDVFAPVRERIRHGRGRIRSRPADYLAYAILDTIVDGYFVTLGCIGEAMEKAEEELVENPTQDTLHTIYGLKRNLIQFRQALWPLRDIVGRLERGESDVINPDTGIFLRDLHDHVLQVIGITETYREMLSGMQDIYLSSVSNKMNDVMKVLTVISTIFIPLSFVAGVYGMNFASIPELQWQWGYGYFWILILTLSAVMVGFFKRKKWF